MGVAEARGHLFREDEPGTTSAPPNVTGSEHLRHTVRLRPAMLGSQPSPPFPPFEHPGKGRCEHRGPEVLSDFAKTTQ